jgi:apoptosis-inducing factor 3
VSDDTAQLTGPDFARGVAMSDIADGGMLAGHALGKPVLVARMGGEILAIGAECTHYGGPLGQGLLVGATVHCPWHHACFSLITGEALRAPALKPVACWTVEQRDGSVFLTGETKPSELGSVRLPTVASPESVGIVGAGAAGNAAAEMLRREGYVGPITMIGVDEEVPPDRPNLSKEYLAGTAPEEWIPLRSPEFYEQYAIKLMLGRRVTKIDVAGKRVELDDGSTQPFGALLLATGAEPIHLPTPASEGSRVFVLRTLADSRAIIAASKDARSVVVVGASFIGLEVAASLRTRGLGVHVVGREARPLERVLGAELGDYVRTLHEQHGVTFHLENSVVRIDAGSATLKSGEALAADFVVMGVGVKPRDELAAAAGLTVDKGVLVNEFLETSARDIFAAGDIARYPDPRTGASIRVEHWVVAERQGQAAARNILGRGEPYTDVPFFWSRHYDKRISYVGHVDTWDGTEITGNVSKGDCVVRYMVGGKALAVATAGHDLESLQAELALGQMR